MKHLLEDFHDPRLDTRPTRIGKLVERAQAALDELRNGKRDKEPAQLARYRHAAAYYGVLRELLAAYGLSDERITEVSIAQEAVIEVNQLTDWAANPDVQMAIKRELDHQLYNRE